MTTRLGRRAARDLAPPPGPSAGPGGRSRTGEMHVRFRDRRRALSDASRRRRRRITLSLLALLAIVAAGVALTFSPLFAVHEITVAGAEGERAEQVRGATGISVGANLLLADVDAAIGGVRRLPWVHAAEVRRVAPSTVAVTVEARTPVAVLRQANASWLVDGDGILLGGGADPALAALDARDVTLPDVGRPLPIGPARTALTIHTQLSAETRALVDRYDADGDGPVRLHLRGGIPSLPPEGFWVVVGDATELPAKELAIARFLTQVAPDPGACDLSTRQWDVRTPENPFCTQPG